MYRTSETYNTNIMSGSTPQDLLLCFDDWYADANEGDVLLGGAEFDMAMSTEQNIRLGACCASTMSCKLINRYNALSSVGWGWARVLIGTRINTATNANTGLYAYYGGTLITGDATGLKIGGSTVISSPIKGFCLDTEYIYVWAEIGARKVDLSNNSVGTWAASDYMKAKLENVRPSLWIDMKEGASVTIGGTTYTNPTRIVYNEKEQETWEYCPMGVYNVDKPAKVKTNTVDISEAYDAMVLLDQSATPLLQDLEYPVAMSAVFTGILEQAGIPLITTPRPYRRIQGNTLWPFRTADKVEANPMRRAGNSYTLRDLMEFLMEYAGCYGRINRDGEFEWYENAKLSNTSTGWRQKGAELRPSVIAMAGIDKSEYKVKQITLLTIETLEGDIYQNGASTATNPNVYQIYGNPFFVDNSLLSDILGTVGEIYLAGMGLNMETLEYPADISVIRWNPAFDPGDLASVYENENDILPGYGIRLQHISMSWNGASTADLSYTGDAVRDSRETAGIQQQYSSTTIREMINYQNAKTTRETVINDGQTVRLQHISFESSKGYHLTIRTELHLYAEPEEPEPEE